MDRRLLSRVFAAILFAPVATSCVGDAPDSSSEATPPNETSADGGANAETGTAACAAGQQRCGDACVDLASHERHCGRCGRACGGGEKSCSEGRCAAITLATNLVEPSAVVAGSTFLLVMTKDGVVQCGKDGCPQGATALWRAAGYVSVPGALTILADSTKSYFLLVSPAGGSPQLYGVDPRTVDRDAPARVTNSTSLTNAGPLASDVREHVFAGATTTYRCLRDSCEDVVKMSQAPSTPLSVALGNAHYVYTTKGAETASVRACARPAPSAVDYGSATDCGPTTVLAGPKESGDRSLRHAIVHDDVVYWTDVGVAGSAPSYVLSCPLSGCNKMPKVIASQSERIDGLAVDASGAYWTTGVAGAVHACRDLAKGCPSAEVVTSGATSPGPIVVDDQFIYFVARAAAGSLLKVAK